MSRVSTYTREVKARGRINLVVQAVRNGARRTVRRKTNRTARTTTKSCLQRDKPSQVGVPYCVCLFNAVSLSIKWCVCSFICFLAFYCGSRRRTCEIFASVVRHVFWLNEWRKPGSRVWIRYQTRSKNACKLAQKSNGRRRVVEWIHAAAPESRTPKITHFGWNDKFQSA